MAPCPCSSTCPLTLDGLWKLPGLGYGPEPWPWESGRLIPRCSDLRWHVLGGAHSGQSVPKEPGPSAASPNPRGPRAPWLQALLPAARGSPLLVCLSLVFLLRTLLTGFGANPAQSPSRTGASLHPRRARFQRRSRSQSLGVGLGGTVIIEPVPRPARKGVRPSIPAGPVRVIKRLSLGVDVRLVSS